MKEAMPASRSYLTFIGVDTGTPVSRFGVYWRHFIRCIIVFSLLSIIGFQVYNILYLDTVYFMAVAQILMFVLQLFTYTRILVKSRKVCQLLHRSFQSMEKAEIRQIRRYDRLQLLPILAYGLLQFFAIIVYYVVNGVGSESTAISLALKQGTKVRPSQTIFSMATFELMTVLFALFVQCYVSLMNVMETIASHVHSELLRSRGSFTYEYERRLRSLKWYNCMMQAVNEDMGCLPFALLGMLFIAFSGGITFLISDSNEQHISPTFACLTVGCVNLLFMGIACNIIKKANRAWKLMSKCWAMANDCVTDPFVTSRNNRESLSMKKALKFYLTTERVLEAKACDCIAINRSLILSFAGQLVPFTVMMFTTFMQFEQKGQKSTR